MAKNKAQNIIVFGARGHAKSVIEVIKCEKKFNIVAVFDNFQPEDKFLIGYENIGSWEFLADFCRKNQVINAAIALGDNWNRKCLFEKIKELVPTLQFPNILHPSSIVSQNVKIGEGTIVMPGAIINTECVCGNFCIINTKASLDHETTIGNFVSIAPGVTIAGQVKINDFSAIGVGANIIEKIQIGSHTLIGAGATVVYDIPEKVIALGTPARIKMMREIGQKYLK